MSEHINLLAMAHETSHPGELELIRLGGDETPLIPFTSDAVRADVHYCQEEEIRGYVHCNQPDCVLCHIGRRQDTRFLLPVYQPAQRSIGVLPISPNMQPYALLPQLFEVLEKHDTSIVIFVRRDSSTKYTVTTQPLSPEVDAGESLIKAFIEKNAEEPIDLSSVFNAYSNKQLALVAPIAETMRLKGLDPDAVD